MVKKLIALLGTLALLVMMLAWQSPSALAAVTKVVVGHNLAAANMLEFIDSCNTVTTTNPPAATPLERNGGSIGTGSIGWQSVAGYEVGALAPVFHPASLNTFAGDVYTPSGSGTGTAVAFYYDNTNANSGYWFGYHTFTHTGSGFAPESFASAVYRWHFLDLNGNNGPELGQNTLQNWALTHDGDARGARVGILMGCEGQPFYFDNLRVADGVDQTVYDFEGAPTAPPPAGAPTTAGLYWYEVKKEHHKKKYVFHTDRLGVWYGTKFALLGAGFAGGRIYAGTGSLYEQRYGSSSFVRTNSGNFSSSRVAAFEVKPTTQTTYEFVSDPTNTYKSATSKSIVVDVYARLNARINDRSLKPGQRAVLSGKIAPGDRGTKVSLQRRVGSRWATVDTTRTDGRGAFAVSIKATRVGNMIVRLNVGSPRKGVKGAYSEWVLVAVTPRPKPPPRNPSGGSGNTTHTETTTATASSAPAPAPTPDDTRVMARLASQPHSGLSAPDAPPACARPGAYTLPPCPPARLG